MSNSISSCINKTNCQKCLPTTFSTNRRERVRKGNPLPRARLPARLRVRRARVATGGGDKELHRGGCSRPVPQPAPVGCREAAAPRVVPQLLRREGQAAASVEAVLNSTNEKRHNVQVKL